MSEHEILLKAGDVRSRYGNISDMSLWRWIRDPKLGFPAPIVINRRRYWKESELAAWERARAGKAA